MPGEDETLAAERERLRGAEKFFAATARGEETLYAGDGAVGERLAACCASSSRWRRWIPALAPLVERLREARRRDRGRRARSRALRAGRPLRSGAARGDRGAAVSAVGGSAASTAARSPIWPRGARRCAPSWPRSARYEEGLAARQAAADAAEARAPRGGRGADALAPAGGQQPGEEGRRRPCASSGFATRAPAGRARRGRATLGADAAPIASGSCSPPTRAKSRGRWRSIASGGELSRVMLAVKQALARTDQVLTYVFDEVDAGVGGGTAEVIGRKLKRLAADRQVIVITHLAAGRRVRRRPRPGHQDVPPAARRASRSSRSDDGERPGEIARMLARRDAVGPGDRARRRDAARRARA